MAATSSSFGAGISADPQGAAPAAALDSDSPHEGTRQHGRAAADAARGPPAAIIRYGSARGTRT